MPSPSKHFLRLSVSLGVVAVVTAGLQAAHAGESHWTYDYTCREAFFSNEHRVTTGGGARAGGPHEYIPGDCSVHPIMS